jgi:hypothetical protein
MPTLILDIIANALQLLVQWLKLKNQTEFYNLTNIFEDKLDKLSQKREELRKNTDSESQEKADDVMNEILEIQKQKKLVVTDWQNRNK